MNNNFRRNVGIIIFNNDKKVLIAKRTKFGSHQNDDFWQFPQGGVKPEESLKDALFREIKEELNLDPDDFNIISETSNWVYYKKKFIKNDLEFDGQMQKWFLVKINNIKLSKISKYLNKSNQNKELSEAKFVPLWFPISKVISFKKTVYKNILTQFSKIILQD